MECYKKKVLFKDRFCGGFDPTSPLSEYQYASAGPITFDDVSSITSSTGNLIIASVPYTKTYPAYLDHIKALITLKRTFKAPKEGELIVESEIGAQQSFSSGIPPQIQAAPGSLSGVTNAKVDLRICSASLTLIDNENFMVYDCAFTDNMIYAYYERAPFGRPEYGGSLGNYSAFSSAIPIGTRKADDITKVQIAYNRHKNYVRWILNGVEVLKINRLGYPPQAQYVGLNLGGIPQIVESKNMTVGFGTFSGMDFYNPLNPGAVDNSGLLYLNYPTLNPVVTDVDGNPIPATNLNPVYDPTLTLFGQGISLTMRYLKVCKKKQCEPYNPCNNRNRCC